MHDTSEPSVMELIFDQLEELIVTLVEEVRERPSVALAIVAGVLGAVVGSVVAARASRGGESAANKAVKVAKVAKSTKAAKAPKQIAKKARGMGDTSDLLGLGMRLLQNPIVRGYVFAVATRQLRKRFTM